MTTTTNVALSVSSWTMKRMPRVAILASVLYACSMAAHAASVIHVADGDCTALVDAVSSASPNVQTTIVLAHGGTYHSIAGVECGIDVHRGNVSIDGAGATLDTTVCASTILSADSGTSLTLRNLVVKSPDCGLGNNIGSSVSNSGALQIEASTLLLGSSIDNAANASMTLRNATIESNVGIRNEGSLNVFNSTLFSTPVASDTGSRFALANSVLTASMGGCSVAASGDSVQSLSGNVLGSGCAFASASDRRSNDSSAGLGTLQDNGGLVPTAVPTSSSVVRNSGLAQYCEATDARELIRPPGACDAGAAQFDAAKSIGMGGMNGTWYDPAANGHYVTIQRVHDDDTVLLIWNAFDRSGNQAWIYGIGNVVDRHIHADMSQNVNGHLQKNGPPTGSTVRAWGTVDIDLTSCLTGKMSYDSALQGFGSGQFSIDRLAYVSDFGCTD